MMRAMIKTIVKGTPVYHYDVGPDELERIVAQSDGIVELLELGDYARGRTPEELVKIREIIGE